MLIFRLAELGESRQCRKSQKLKKNTYIHSFIFSGPMFFSVKESGRSGKEKKKQAAEHLQEMEVQMLEAQKQMEDDKVQADKRQQALQTRQEILTPGGVTPRRTPSRIGL